MNSAGDILARLSAAVLLAATMVGCSDPVADACDERRPDGYGRECAGDGECSSYLKCIEDSCVLPPTMSGQPESTTVELRLVPEPGAAPAATFQAELAVSTLELNRGLSLRPCMQAGWAMLFTYRDAGILHHQTHQMQYSIDLAFADEDGVIVDVFRAVPPGSMVSSTRPAKFVVETRAGALSAVSVGHRVAW